MSTKLPNGEFSCEWKCPQCNYINADSVDPYYGPWWSCICSNCGEVFKDEELDPTSINSWVTARTAAEQEGKYDPSNP